MMIAAYGLSKYFPIRGAFRSKASLRAVEGARIQIQKEQIVGLVGGTLFTFLFARRLMRRLSSRFVAHGIVLALAAVALSLGGSIAGHHGVPRAYILASVLKLAAGVLAGSAYARGLGRNQNVV